MPRPSSAPSLPLAQDLDRIFRYHSPVGDQPQRYQAIRDAARQFAQVIVDNTGGGADQTAVIDLLRVVVMRANATIALEG